MSIQNRLETNRARSSRYPRIFTNAKTGERKTVKNSDMDYIERVKQYINLKGVTNRPDLNIRLTKAGLFGKHRQYKQMNIISKELNLAIRGTPTKHKKYWHEIYYRKTYTQIIYRDIKTGRFITKPKPKKKRRKKYE